MSVNALYRRGREARAWFFEACFPLWAERGVQRGADGKAGFLEALDLEHRPIKSELARVRVQARQTYVFTEALRLGWQTELASDLVDMGVDVLANVCRRPDGVFGRRIDLDARQLSDETADLYDTAFGLYALAGARKTALDEADKLIDEVSDAMEAVLADPSGGYVESLPRPEYRLQNPHMHLFEASLELHAKTGAVRHITRATQMRDLFMTHFLDRKTGTLGEHFMPETWAIPKGDAGDIIEPGHQFEWVWLLARYAQMTKGGLPDDVSRLYELACLTLDEKGRAAQSCLRDGTLVDRSRRTWPQTEALKAHLVMWRAGEANAGERAAASFDVLMDEYLTPEGGWIDHLSEDGQVLATNMPASTGYHVVLAFAELIKAVEA